MIFRNVLIIFLQTKRTMKIKIFYILILLFIIQGCAYTVPQIKTKDGMVQVGMSKEEVLAVWGKPYHKWLQNQSLDSDMWLYPGKYWWGASQIELRFDENGILKEIELIQD